MSSSTSSSRKTFGRIFLAVTVGMAAAMAIIRLITFLNDVSGDTILARVQEARAALPRIVDQEEPLVLAFGSSMTQAGFGARQFDRELAEQGIRAKSFNFGFGGLNPYFQDYLAKRIRDAFDAEGRRLELAMLEFCPFQVTTARFDGARPVIDSFVTMLASDRELWEIARQDPVRGVRMLNIRYLRDDISAEMITHEFGRGFQTPRPRTEIPEDEANSERMNELNEKLSAKFDEEYPDWDGAAWSWTWQGAGTIPEERSEETKVMLAELYETLRHPRELDDDKLNRIACCDIEALHFEEELVAAWVRIIRTFQQFSNRVELVLLPRNTDWIHYSPEATARLDAVLDRLAQETGVTVANFQEIPEVDPEMFSDTTHLSRYAGDVAYTSFLVRRYAPYLAEAAR